MEEIKVVHTMFSEAINANEERILNDIMARCLGVPFQHRIPYGNRNHTFLRDDKERFEVIPYDGGNKVYFDGDFIGTITTSFEFSGSKPMITSLFTPMP